jgi:pyrroloquinoline quinone biosynthesis protein B
VTANGSDWCLINCSPDLRSQIIATPPLHPRGNRRLRDSPVRAVVLTNADVDHVAGLLTLREGEAFDLYATEAVLEVIAANPIFAVLDPALVRRRPMRVGEPVGPVPGVTIEPYRVPGKVALYLEKDALRAGDLDTSAESDHTVGLHIRGRRATARFHYVPGCAAMTPALARRLDRSPLVLFDGTAWSDDELVSHGLGAKTARRMGHMSMDGEAGSIAAFSGLAVGRKIFIHINNSNPVLIEDSRERALAEGAGWEIAHDGMEVVL